ncbi:hypothetical protein [Dyadobacter linearis]|uniref:hypothetical protein n=1 Tax=Dyadobacter linearis TaxID=2823330 RepID=UPI001BFC3169|nr:hypothetical protein [Dyadobacter sp. CECT 9623]
MFLTSWVTQLIEQYPGAPAAFNVWVLAGAAIGFESQRPSRGGITESASKGAFLV